MLWHLHFTETVAGLLTASSVAALSAQELARQKYFSFFFLFPFTFLFVCFDFSNEIHSLKKTPLSIMPQVKKKNEKINTWLILVA